MEGSERWKQDLDDTGSDQEAEETKYEAGKDTHFLSSRDAFSAERCLLATLPLHASTMNLVSFRLPT